MGLKRLVIDGFGQLELNNAAFRRDGRVEAQCELDETDFATDVAENGMLLAVDKINKTIKYAKNASLPIAINYSAEHMYDDRANGLKDFSLKRGEFYPRVGYLAVGDLFTTNCICFDDSEFEAVTTQGEEATAEEVFIEALEDVATTPLYGGISAMGAIKVSATKPQAGPVLAVTKKTTMPDGQLAVQFQVYEA